MGSKDFTFSGSEKNRNVNRQLLASLDEYVYKEIVAPLRRDTELDTVDIEDIYEHPASSVDVQQLIADFQFHIDAAHEMPNTLKDNMEDGEPPRRWPTQ
ncbi:hypothetical protein CYMTET_27722 [Cymbomonas tetramitiformis]|uniref:Uncharacterized protein n=1 Tax=Cymbomonas tetramitiformis TaxID=36881 RepID=A0AAE0FP71_9CHLO|nr:hypothetical protein CYMTET_27722 [Cymbomonas tetramitiformis]